MADVEATIATEYHPIEKVALARTVHAGNWKHANGPIQRPQVLSCLLIYLKLYTIEPSKITIIEYGNDLLPLAWLNSTKGIASST